MPQWPSLRLPLALPRATKDLKNRPVGTSWWDDSLQGRRGCLPQPQPGVCPSQLSGSRESTHSVSGTVGSMFVLCGLVPLVRGHSVVHEPETRGTIPGNSVTEFPEVLKTSAPTGGKTPLLSSLPLSDTFFWTIQYFVPNPQCGYRTLLNIGMWHGLHFLFLNFLYTSLTYSTAPQGYSLMNFYTCTHPCDQHPEGARVHFPAPRKCP